MIRRQWTCDSDSSTRRGALKLLPPGRPEHFIMCPPCGQGRRGKASQVSGWPASWGDPLDLRTLWHRMVCRADKMPSVRRDLSRSGEERGLPSSVATPSGHTPARSPPRATWFTRRSQTPLPCRDSPQLTSRHPHALPWGLPGGISTKGHSSLAPASPEDGRDTGSQNAYLDPANCFWSTSLAQLSI